MNMNSRINSEAIPEKRELSVDDRAEAKVVKRRRRSPSLLNLNYNEQQQPTTFQLDDLASNNNAAKAISATTTVKRSSRFRGVSRHRWTGRYEAHLWDKGSWNVTQKKKGKQVYLGAYDVEEAAARSYDLAAIKYWGTSTFTNFPKSDYEKEIEIMQNMTKEEYLASLRRRNSGFARGVSKYRGVARHHHNGRWEAKIGRIFGNNYLYLGTYGTQEEAAKAYDIVAIEYRGMNAVTNFDLSTYITYMNRNNNGNRTDPPGPTSSDRIPALDSGYSSQQETNLARSFALKNPMIAHHQKHRHEIVKSKMPLSPCKRESASPTALGLLLRSSMYRELMEKTTNEEINNDRNKEVRLLDWFGFDRVGFGGSNKEDNPEMYDRTGMFFRDFFSYDE